MSYDWYAFVSPGANFSTSHHGTKVGNSYLYQWGFARYIKALSPPGCIFDLMIEFDGTYSQKNRRFAAEEPDSGGNVLGNAQLLALLHKLAYPVGGKLPHFAELEWGSRQNKICN